MAAATVATEVVATVEIAVVTVMVGDMVDVVVPVVVVEVEVEEAHHRVVTTMDPPAMVTGVVPTLVVAT